MTDDLPFDVERLYNASEVPAAEEAVQRLVLISSDLIENRSNISLDLLDSDEMVIPIFLTTREVALLRQAVFADGEAAAEREP
jgi:hypothetical protein